MKTLVVIESPYQDDPYLNTKYLKRCLKDSLLRGEAPFASHLLYTQVLDDLIVEERLLGMEAGFAWGGMADLCAVYMDRGISEGMLQGVISACQRGIPVELRWLDREDEE